MIAQELKETAQELNELRKAYELQADRIREIKESQAKIEEQLAEVGRLLEIMKKVTETYFLSKQIG